MADCIEFGRKNTKYKCIKCSSFVCQICSEKADENTAGYSEENKTLGWCKKCNDSRKCPLSIDVEDVNNVKKKKQQTLTSFFSTDFKHLYRIVV